METTTEEVRNSSVPRGGPIYLPNMVGPLTSVHGFQSSVRKQLQVLETELLSDATVSDENDILVDDLKVFTEEELVDMALKEAFKDDGDSRGNSKPLSGKDSDAREGGKFEDPSDKRTCLGSSRREEDFLSQFESSNGHSSGGQSKKRKKKKPHQRRKIPKHPSEESYIEKVEQLAKLKEKQEEEKKSARLHCLKSVCNPSEGATNPTLEKFERMTTLRSAQCETMPVKSTNSQEVVPVVFPEVVLCIEVYHNKNKWSKTQELLVLGDQKLTELRDKIYCLTDLVMKKAGQHDPSGYVLIEDIFCNDLRDPSAIDYSQPILDWLRNSKDEALRKWESILTGDLQRKQKAVLGEVKSMDLPHFKAVDMDKMRFCDLRFRLGAGYLYCHQGDCKHMVVIRDMRMIHPDDVRNRAAYPRIIFQLKSRVQKCNVCKIYRATRFTVDDKWARDNPCYFCDYCFSLLHSEDGPLNSNFSVYDYLHD